MPGHHCKVCKRVVDYHCFRKGHVAKCNECGSAFNPYHGCSIHSYSNGFNLEAKQHAGRRASKAAKIEAAAERLRERHGRLEPIQDANQNNNDDGVAVSTSNVNNNFNGQENQRPEQHYGQRNVQRSNRQLVETPNRLNREPREHNNGQINYKGFFACKKKEQRNKEWLEKWQGHHTLIEE
jgi:hypothetical protein